MPASCLVPLDFLLWGDLEALWPEVSSWLDKNIVRAKSQLSMEEIKLNLYKSLLKGEMDCLIGSDVVNGRVKPRVIALVRVESDNISGIKALVVYSLSSPVGIKWSKRCLVEFYNYCATVCKMNGCSQIVASSDNSVVVSFFSKLGADVSNRRIIFQL